jgi:hypothetical protein
MLDGWLSGIQLRQISGTCSITDLNGMCWGQLPRDYNRFLGLEKESAGGEKDGRRRERVRFVAYFFIYFSGFGSKLILPIFPH